MATRLPTFSSLGRVAACPASAALPAVHEVSVDAVRGTARHMYLSLVPQMGEGAAIDLVPAEHRAACEVIDLEGLPLDPTVYQQEVALAYDVATGEARLLGHALGRTYPDRSPTELSGTVDVLGVYPDHVHVADYKGEHDDSLAPARTNLQLLAGAVAAARLYGRERAVVELIHIRDDGTWWSDRAELEELDLAAGRAELAQLAGAVRSAERAVAAGNTPAVTRGDHCRWCPAFRECPSTLALARRLALASQGPNPENELAELVRGALTPDLAPVALERLRLLKKVVEVVEGELKAWARVTPIPMPNGKVYGPTTRESIRGAVATGVLLRLHGAEVAQAATVMPEPKVTKSSIEAALDQVAAARKAAGVKTTKKALLAEVMAELRAGGGIVESEELREHTP